MNLFHPEKAESRNLHTASAGITRVFCNGSTVEGLKDILRGFV